MRPGLILPVFHKFLMWSNRNPPIKGSPHRFAKAQNLSFIPTLSDVTLLKFVSLITIFKTWRVSSSVQNPYYAEYDKMS